MRVEEWKKLLERERIIEFLPYFQYEDGIYFLRDGGVGFAFECAPLPFVDRTTRDAFLSIFSSIPEGTAFQAIFLASPDTTHEIDHFKLVKEAAVGGLAKDVVEDYAQFLEEKSHERISESFPVPIRNYRLILTFKLGGKNKVYSLLEGIKRLFLPSNGEKPEEEEELIRRTKEAQKLLRTVRSSLERAKVAPALLEPDRLIDLLYPFFHMKRDYRDKPKWDGADISDCLIENDFKMEIHEDYTVIDGVYGKSLCVKDYPEKWSFANSFYYAGDPLKGDGVIPAPYMFVLNGIKMDESEKGTIKRNASIVLSQHMPYALFPRLRMKHEDLSYGMDKIEKGEDIWYVNLSLFVFGKTKEELDSAVGFAKTQFKTLGFRLEEDRYINHAVFLSNIPFGYDLKTHKFLGRGRVVFAENVTDLVPIFGDPQVFGKPEVVFISPRGQLMGFDIFSTGQGGYNGFIVGMTGSGKSVMLQWFSLMYLLSGKKVRIIDIGRSYEKFCHNFDGTFIAVDFKNPISVNPFSSVENEDMLTEYMEFLTSFFLLIGGSKDEQTFLQQEKILRSFLGDAIREAYARYGKEANINNVRDILKKISDPRVQDFVLALKPYTTEGEYGKFFNPPSNIDLSNQLVVLENDTVENIPDLREPLLMMFTFFISREVYLSKEGKGLVTIIDEAHKFLGNPKTDIFIEQAYRRFRKDGASIILGTQSFEDFTGAAGLTRAGKAAISNSFWQMFMMQTSSSKQALRQKGELHLTEWEDAMMDSAYTYKGQFSEVFIKTEAFSIKGRLILNNFLKAMFFTDPQIRRKMKELVENGMSYRDAVKALEEMIG